MKIVIETKNSYNFINNIKIDLNKKLKLKD